jgi:hypothetical protein
MGDEWAAVIAIWMREAGKRWDLLWKGFLLRISVAFSCYLFGTLALILLSSRDSVGTLYRRDFH